MRIYGHITKLEPQDDGTLKVVGVASSGAVDAADERVAPMAMKAALPDYMRFAALREMHGMSAAGATLGAEVGEDGLTRIEAHVVDPLAVKKVKLGVYKGFSIGGRVTARDPADPKLITGLKLDEISLVDRPCNPEAVIQMWKADGLATAPAPTNAEVIAKATELAAAAGRPGRHTEFVVKARAALTQAAALAPPPTPLSPPTAPAASPESGLGEPTAKRGARNSAADMARIQAAHDQMVALGAQCGHDHEEDDEDDLEDDDADDDESDDDLDEAADNSDDDADKAVRLGDLSRLAARAPGASANLAQELAGLRRTVADLQKRLDQVSAEPQAPKTMAGWARAVTKTEDVAAHPGGVDPDALSKYLDSLTPEERGRIELRAALSRPIVGR